MNKNSKSRLRSCEHLTLKFQYKREDGIKYPKGDRYCQLFKKNIEDEYHYLFKYKHEKVQNLRKNMYPSCTIDITERETN